MDTLKDLERFLTGASADVQQIIDSLEAMREESIVSREVARHLSLAITNLEDADSRLTRALIEVMAQQMRKPELNVVE